MDTQLPRGTNHPPSRAVEPTIKKYRPRESPDKSDEADASPGDPTAASGPPPPDLAASAGRNRVAGAATDPPRTNRPNWILQLAAEAEKGRDPLAGLLADVCADLRSAMVRVAESSQKVCSTLPANSADVLKITCVSADKQAAVAKQIFNYVQFLDKRRLHQNEPLRRPT